MVSSDSVGEVPRNSAEQCSVASAASPGSKTSTTHAAALTASIGVRTFERSCAAADIGGFRSTSLTEDADAFDRDFRGLGNGTRRDDPDVERIDVEGAVQVQRIDDVRDLQREAQTLARVLAACST